MKKEEIKNWLLRILFTMHSKKKDVTMSILNKLRDKKYKDETFDWEIYIEEGIKEGLVKQEKEKVFLTELGLETSEKMIKQDFQDGFNETLKRWDESENYRKMCEKIYGIYLGSLDMMTQNQLDTLIDELAFDEMMNCLDLGCGIGRITEYISDKTKAKFTGIDIADEAMKRANERTIAKQERLGYKFGDLDHLELEENTYDRIIAIDSLYFAYDLQKVVQQILDALKKDGKAGLFYSQRISKDGDRTMLKAENTDLGKILHEMQVSVKTFDFTKEEEDLWNRKLEVVNEMEQDFIDSDEEDIMESRIREASDHITYIDDKRLSRYLYIFEKNSKR